MECREEKKKNLHVCTSPKCLALQYMWNLCKHKAKMVVRLHNGPQTVLSAESQIFARFNSRVYETQKILQLDLGR